MGRPRIARSGCPASLTSSLRRSTHNLSIAAKIARSSRSFFNNLEGKAHLGLMRVWMR
jgi:hypothetical protein